MTSPSTLAEGEGTLPLGPDMLAEHLYRVFGELEEANRARRAAIRTPADWDGERARLLAAYQQMLGQFPERNELAPQITGRVEREHYTIEKLIYQSQPGLLVTANAYVPRHTRGRAPGVLVPCGHSENGKAAETYQRVCAGLARKGYFVLTYDPIGQGERKLCWDRDRRVSALGGGTTQHTYAGNQYVLAGASLAQLMVWDSIRAIDYLWSRPEVDHERIAMAGNSGGGTNTAQTAPLDDRIRVAVPCCYITTLRWRRRVWSTGDAEQNLAGQLAAGLDLADYLRLMAPRPVLVGSAALDYFPLEGAREAVEIARTLYSSLGVADRIEHVVADAPHGYSVGLRRGTYRWLNRWFDVDAGDDEPASPVESDAELQCTPEGQVALLGSVDAHTLLHRRLAQPMLARTLSPIDAARRLTAFEAPAERPPARPPQSRIFRFEGLRRVETFEVWPESDVVVPGEIAIWRAHAGPKRALLWIATSEADAPRWRAAYSSVASTLLPHGWLMATVDVRGTGVTAPRSTGRANAAIMGAEAFLTYESFIAGRPLLGMRVRDAACAVDYLFNRPDVDASGGVTVVGWAGGGLIALHLAAFDERIRAVATVETPVSYRATVESERYSLPASAIVPGIVAGPDSPNGYDLDDLAAAIAPRPVLRLRPIDETGEPIGREADTDVPARLSGWVSA